VPIDKPPRVLVDLDSVVLGIISSAFVGSSICLLCPTMRLELDELEFLKGPEFFKSVTVRNSKASVGMAHELRENPMSQWN